MNEHALTIINEAIKASDPYDNVYNKLKDGNYPNNITVISVGKAACPMARASYDALGKKIKTGYVLTKYFHSSPLPSVFSVHEAGHPLPDENSVRYTDEIIDTAHSLDEDDYVIFLLSGGASAIFESPLIPLTKLQSVTQSLLNCSADITEINTIRKRLSKVKGGKFSQMCNCHIDCLILSDVLGDKLDMIASGPCAKDTSTAGDVMNIINKYNLHFDDEIMNLLSTDGITDTSNVTSYVVGNIEILCKSAADTATKLGYKTRIVNTSLTGEAGDAGRDIAHKAVLFAEQEHSPTCFIYGGETTVTIKGSGKGGRNQELVLSAVPVLAGSKNITMFSVGSDGTDGPTDAAGGIVTCNTLDRMKQAGIDIDKMLLNNDSYNALKACDCLVITGATGTNVNDLTGILIN